MYLLRVGNLDESEQYLRECLDIYRHSLQEKHPHTAFPLKYLGKCLMKQGNNKEAEKLLSEAVGIQAVGLHQHHPDKIDTLILWSECLLNIADYTRAQPALFDALQIINSNQQPSNSRQRSEVMRLLRRLSPFQRPQSGETIIGEGKAEEVEQTDERRNRLERKSWIEDQGDDHPDQSPPTMENLDICDLCHPLWVGGTLEVLHVGSSDGLSFHETIGSEGGELSAGSVSITVPAGAVQSPTQFSIHSFMHDKYMPPVSASGYQVVSPVIFLGPHDVSFSKPIKVCINTIADVTSAGGSFTLMRCESRLNETKWRWRGVVVYSPDTQEVQSHIPFDPNSWSVEVTSFSGWLWLVSFIKSPTILFRRKMGCVVLSQSLSSCKWSLSVHLFNSYEEIGQKIIRDHQGHVSLPAIQLCPVTEIIVRKQGHVVMKPQLGPEWSLCRGDVEVQLPTRHLWRQSFDHDHCFTFVVEAIDSCPDSLEFPVRVEYIRQGEVDFSLTLEAVHKLSKSADSSNSSLPSQSPLPDEEQEALFFCSEEGLYSSGSTSSSTAARDRTSSQRSIIQQPADVHTVSQCDVSPIYSKVQEKSPLLVRLPVGSEVPYTGCIFRYIDTTGQTVEEVPGERLDSRTIETVTPAWPRADRVEIHIFPSDGQTRLGYFVHVFIDPSAEMLPRIVNHEDDSSIVPGAVNQETDKVETEQQKRLESSAKSKCTDKEMLSVTCKVFACWQEFVSHLSPTFFTMDRIDRIKGNYHNNLFLQTKKALEMWTKKYGVKATRRSIITAMCDINDRLQAERIFCRDLVEHVCPYASK
ncbi:uncharacterized protein LOC134189014 isoform X2 [Corticium candelabrum]|uniref:uncharacterized protein LOC134189014 isoform X2 n=1 Tax=Corticium candelabrum TaxID=121492 RepID=UPI002E25D1BD|nr:uncharacterized protein LOC134189014 isoform X2 [Corticium candelabrum]